MFVCAGVGACACTYVCVRVCVCVFNLAVVRACVRCLLALTTTACHGAYTGVVLFGEIDQRCIGGDCDAVGLGERCIGTLALCIALDPRANQGGCLTCGRSVVAMVVNVEECNGTGTTPHGAKKPCVGTYHLEQSRSGCDGQSEKHNTARTEPARRDNIESSSPAYHFCDIKHRSIRRDRDIVQLVETCPGATALRIALGPSCHQGGLTCRYVVAVALCSSLICEV